MRVGLFVTCLVDLMRPSIGFASIKLLEAAGCEVIVPSAQTCCGQPGYNSGDKQTARDLARKVLAEFAECDYVVAPSGSCAGMIRVHYPTLFAGDPDVLARLTQVSNYVSVTTGAKQAGETDGPEHFHIVLVDSGRSQLLGSELKEALRCIRCGACMNHCPIYQNVGGHAYGWVYPGPIGAVLTPAYVGIENALDLPQVSTLCNECGVVCPVKIPLPDLMRVLREKQFEGGMRPWHERLAIRAWRTAALSPRLYALLARIGARTLRYLGGRSKLLHRLPGPRRPDRWPGHAGAARRDVSRRLREKTA